MNESKPSLPDHARDATSGHAPQGQRGKLLGLTLGAVGIVYGDIGTSPLYAINEIFYGHGGVARAHDNVIGCISLILWTLTLIIAFKYVFFVLRADNDGEGGTFALYGLIHRYKRLGLGALLSLLILALACSSARGSSRQRSACSRRSRASRWPRPHSNTSSFR